MVSGERAILQVQPQAADREAWAALAEENGLAFEALEFALEPLLTDPQARERAAAWYRDGGRAHALHAAFIDVNPASSDPGQAALSLRRLRESCETAVQIGAAYVVVHGSCFPFLRGAYMDTWAQRFAAAMDELAGAYGLTLCVENSMDVDPAPLCAVMERVQSDRVCVCLDIGHAAYSRETVDVWFEQLGTHIGYLHLSDNDGAFDTHLPLGQGKVDWALADRCYRALGRSVPMTLEVGTMNGVRSSIAWLKENRYFGLGE